MGCALCDGKVGIFSYNTIEDLDVCSDCYEQFNVLANATAEQYADFFGKKRLDAAEQRMREYASVRNAAGARLAAALKVFDEIKSNAEIFAEDRKRQEELELSAVAEYKNVILTTTNNVQGYRVVEYLGLVFGETIYKASFVDTMDAIVDNVVKSFSFSAKELSSSVRLQEEARQFAIKKMQLSAYKMGANAIIGIDTDNTVGSTVAYLSIHGTAVRIEQDD